MVKVSIQTKDFSLDEEYRALREATHQKVGAICTFTGIVRDFGDSEGLSGIELEHYPGMTQKVLESLIERAEQRWSLQAVRIIHRTGKLSVDDQIVLVMVASSHRKDAFDACQFLMDFLKTEAPFWKKEIKQNNSHWVKAKNSDKKMMQRW